MENDKNSTRKHVGMFQVQNQVIMAWFSTSSTLVGFVTELAMKF